MAWSCRNEFGAPQKSERIEDFIHDVNADDIVSMTKKRAFVVDHLLSLSSSHFFQHVKFPVLSTF